MKTRGSLQENASFARKPVQNFRSRINSKHFHGLSFILHIAMPPVACSDDESSAVIDDAVVDVSSMPHNLLKRAHDEVESPDGEMPPQTRVRTDGTGASSSHEAVDDELASVLDLKAGIEDMLVMFAIRLCYVADVLLGKGAYGKAFVDEC